MIPAFNCAKYLRQTLESVLAQDPGAEQMQIEVVDDVSTKDDPEAVVREVGRGRVAFHRKPQNEGAIRNFNTCIERSRGKLVHILHGDDYVLPGFYARITAAATEHPEMSAFFARCFVIDEDGAIDKLGDRAEHLAQPTRLPGDSLYANYVMTPGVVVRRPFYEKFGGFLISFPHVADWEMWVRAIHAGGALWLNEPLAAYRVFAENDTGRLARSGENLRDCLRLGSHFESRFNNFDRGRFRAMVAQLAHHQKKKFTRLGDPEAARASDVVWRQLTPWPLQWGRRLYEALAPPRKSDTT
jgi:glycosyltransferase involved in cell wall biosynthesis